MLIPQIRYHARLVLISFLTTFLISRILVLLIMTRRIPDLYLHLGGTHMHHLNYGIFILCFVAGWALFVPLQGRYHRIALVGYGISLALTFDEFGMWFHLGGGYWQRASFDAVVVITSLLLLFAFLPSFSRFRIKQWISFSAILVIFGVFLLLLIERLNRFGTSMGPWLEQVEQSGPK